jgi:3-hydroxypropanoate dehydrogenase
MIELTDEQKIAVASAQKTFSNLKNNTDSLNETQLNLLFGEARSMNGWQDKDVPDNLIKSIYDLTKMGPTSTNCCPARFKFVKSEEQKLKLKESLLPNNIDKVMSAPVIAIIGFDLDFSDNMGKAVSPYGCCAYV